ncbi:hypothetical protein QUA62_03670 [Microcoleus sp. MON1_C1]|uniref:hypothetical protein n=1 Tax=Microcoleus sp. MON1_C1 TaxID=2818827 RepID=UPI002FD070AF
MSNENKLIYPTVDLFVYDLAQGMGQDEEKISQNRQLFWQKIYGDKISATQLEQLKQAETETADYIELLGDKQVEKFEFNLDGYSYPVKLNDTYAALFNFSGVEVDEYNKFKPKEIDCLESLKKEVISRVNPSATIGQSLLVSGQLTANDQDALKTAQTCYSQLNLVPNAKWERDLKADGQFLGADFYELWLPPGDMGNIGQNYHVLICLFPHNSGESFDVTKEKLTKLYPHFLQLFAYRNKVIWAYTQSRPLKAELKGYPEKIQQIVDRLPAQVNAPKIDLKELQQSLVNSRTIFSVYANQISRLGEKENTIKTNLKNYDKRLKTIGEKMGSGPKAFKFMKSFSDFAQERYVWQVEADNRSLSAELRLLENAIQTIEGISEIERAKSDHALNVTIAAAGVGIATSGVAASVYAGQIKPPQNPIDAKVVFGLSMGVGFVLSVLSAIVLIAIGKKWR